MDVTDVDRNGMGVTLAGAASTVFNNYQRVTFQNQVHLM